jgi:hypothetical protein
MRIRQVKPEFWSDAALQMAVGPEVLLFYIGLWNEADDGGWLRWDLVEIAADLYRYQPNAKRVKNATRFAARLVDLGKVVIDECGMHALIPNFAKHQHLSAEDKQVHTHSTEHAERCLQGSPPADPRGDPREVGRDGDGSVRVVKVDGDPGHEFAPTVDGVCDLIIEKWHWPLVTPKQRELITALADRHAPGRAGYSRLIELLSMTTTGDPITFFKQEDARLKKEGRRRADAQEAESARWRNQATPSSSRGVASLGEILSALPIEPPEPPERASGVRR